jgi:hypothetical protein
MDKSNQSPARSIQSNNFAHTSFQSAKIDNPLKTMNKVDNDEDCKSIGQQSVQVISGKDSLNTYEKPSPPTFEKQSEKLSFDYQPEKPSYNFEKPSSESAMSFQPVSKYTR